MTPLRTRRPRSRIRKASPLASRGSSLQANSQKMARLSDCSIQKESTLHVVLRLRGAVNSSALLASWPLVVSLCALAIWPNLSLKITSFSTS